MRSTPCQNGSFLHFRTEITLSFCPFLTFRHLRNLLFLSLSAQGCTSKGPGPRVLPNSETGDYSRVRTVWEGKDQQ